MNTLTVQALGSWDWDHMVSWSRSVIGDFKVLCKFNWFFPNFNPKFSANHQAFCYLDIETVTVLHCLQTLKQGLEFEKTAYTATVEKENTSL